jgi:hypothetical protein
MAAKEVKFSVEARDRMLRGIDILNNAVKVTLRTGHTPLWTTLRPPATCSRATRT